MTPEDIDTLRNTVREALRCSTLGDTSMNVVAAEDLDALVAITKEAEQSLPATRNALSRTQQVRDYYKQLAEEWLNEAAKLRVEAATFKQVAHFHAARVAELEADNRAMQQEADEMEAERDALEGFMGDVLAGCDIQRGARLFRQVEVVIGPGKTRAEIRVAALERRVADLLAQGAW